MKSNPAPCTSTHGSMPATRVLVVDDESQARMLMRDFLEDTGFEVLEAENGLEGIAVIEKEGPDAVLTDIRMPLMDGLKLVEAMKKVAPLTPAIIISGNSSMDHVIRALRLGAWDFILKPVRDQEILHHTICKALERSAHLAFEKNYKKKLEKDVAEKTSKLQDEVFAREIAQRNLRYEAYHDSLTQLGNRLLCLKNLQQLITSPGRKYFGFLLFDFNNFKDINDAYGYSFGDQLLINLAKRLTNSPQKGENLYRMGADEFAVFVQGQSLDEIVLHADIIAKQVSQPYEIGKENINARFSFGMTLFDRYTNGPEKLISEAAFAHLQAKKNCSEQIVVYDDQLHQQHLRRLSLGKEMPEALAGGEFYLVFQPIVDHNSGKISGFEGLLRWDSSKYGAVAPNEFIPIAEDKGFIAELGEWAVENGCRFWARNGFCQKGLTLSMNVSGKQFFQQGLVRNFKKIMDSTGFDPHFFCLEITESALMSNICETIKKLHQFKKLGVKISVDDFGTGYSSLEYLHKFPVNALKIDMSFVQKIDTDPKTHELIKVMSNMASVFDLELVAEGVETTVQKEMLCHIGCNLHQGFYYSRPLAQENVCNLDHKFK
ncbi:MAG: EAL domain-containing protein [Deltaproteobacteria bacterium]|nr:EAL domain-containing protein [Deltaproteobacteria bacterium]